jgi:hypothetical protein
MADRPSTDWFIGLMLIIVIIYMIYYSCSCSDYIDQFSSSGLKFQAPMSLTNLKGSGPVVKGSKGTKGTKKDLKKDQNFCNIIAKLCSEESDEIVKGANSLNMPSFFYSDEKWPGCLPRPLYQGTCGSCWGFAVSTCLASRFYIESCGNTGCDNYPQLNFGSLNQVYSNLNETYKFRKIYLDNIIEFIDADNNNNITRKEWVGIAKKNRDKIWDLKLARDTRHLIVQILIYMLDFQSLGSLNLGSPTDVEERANKTYGIWLKFIGAREKDGLSVEKLQDKWRAEPLNLSAEKLVACCVNCIEMDFQQQATKEKEIKKDGKVVDNPLCMGGTLDDAWILIRDTGTTSTLCTGYNMDQYTPGDSIPSCREVQGPYYSFCSGYVLATDPGDPNSSKILRNKISKMESSGENPVSISHNEDVPWVDPQLFRFRAKNAYNVSNNVQEIQREIIERGPVTTGFIVYNDFQYAFGTDGMGGQKYSEGTDNPLGSTKKSLIYIHDPNIKDEKSIGGHAITIVGWGTYIHEEVSKGKDGVTKKEIYKIPYWICLNSWGVEWGHSGVPDYVDRNGMPNDLKQGGYFWMVRGIDNCSIEDNVVAGQPNIENISYPGVTDRYGWGLPGPSNTADFLEPLNTKDLELGKDTLDILPSLDGGGTYINFKKTDPKSGEWQIKSMGPPSPYTMFWPASRPVFCIGKTENKLESKISSEYINVENSTINWLLLIQKNSPTPLLIINNLQLQEQVQLVSIDKEKNQIKIKRGVNYSKLQDHKKGAQIKVFPYHNLSIEFFRTNGFSECSMFTEHIVK